MGYYRKNSKYNASGHRGIPWKAFGLGTGIAAILICAIVGSVMWSRSSGAGDETNVVSGEAVEVTATPKTASGSSAAAASGDAVTPPASETKKKKRAKAVALTFDDGPSTENTPKALKVLKKYDAHATFFVVGSRVAEGAKVLKQVVEQGNEIGNHSWDHSSLAQMSMKKVNREYDRTAKLVKKLVGYDVKLLRPPYGAISQAMRKKLKHPMILWSVDTLDWKSKNPKKILKEVKKQVKDGSIILMHDIHPTTVESLDAVLSWLTKNGYDVLTVSELAERKGSKIKNGKAYGALTGGK
jgi:peptidoglycan/xylan/chitin deacetylase (PgdA/CDA1 family)